MTRLLTAPVVGFAEYIQKRRCWISCATVQGVGVSRVVPCGTPGTSYAPYEPDGRYTFSRTATTPKNYCCCAEVTGWATKKADPAYLHVHCRVAAPYIRSPPGVHSSTAAQQQWSGSWLCFGTSTNLSGDFCQNVCKPVELRMVRGYKVPGMALDYTRSLEKRTVRRSVSYLVSGTWYQVYYVVRRGKKKNSSRCKGNYRYNRN